MLKPTAARPQISPKHKIKGQAAGNGEVHRADLEHRPHTQKLHVDGGCQRARDHERNERARLEFKQQQLDGENHSGDRSVEGGRHAGSGAAGEQHFALDRRGVERLADQRADRSARLNDRAFRAERAAGADRNGRRDGLQDGHTRGDPAAVEQHRLHGFRNAVALDFRRAVLGHDAHNEAADDRNDDDHPAEMVVLRAGEIGRPAMEEEEVGEQADQLVESESYDAGHQTDCGGEE